MTQVKSARLNHRELARYLGADHRSLTARRAAFAAQMRAMALSDLSEVAIRLKGLKGELERREGRKWSDYDLAAEMGIKPRTFQSWQNGEVENRDGKGYDKMARFYSRKLGRKIARKWILFGDDEAAPVEIPVSEPEPSEVDQLRKEFDRKLLILKNELRAEIAKELGPPEAPPSSQESDEQH
jgi:transcriptional regulator with XRE-family HTH domain